ncbi:mycofactocin system transcriptional regulator [Jatrophihabitans sp. YIM 134969]
MTADALDTRARVGRRPSTSRAELEQVAFALFAERGFDDTAVDDIASAAGIARRTFFRYYASKTDLVWGDFDAELDRFRAWFDAVPPGDPVLQAVRRAVVDFNFLPSEQVPAHRERMSLILQVPTLFASSTLRFVQWREVIASFVAARTGAAAADLLPVTVGHTALGATLAAYEQWLLHPDAELAAMLDDALGQLADGFPGLT